MDLYNFLLVSLLLSIIIGSAAAILAWRERPQPGSRPLVLMLIGQLWWSISIIFRLNAVTVEEKLFWMTVLWAGVVVIPLGWLLFALEYTGRDGLFKTRYIGLFSAIPLLTWVIALTAPFHDLLVVQALGFGQNGVLQVGFTGTWYPIVTIYTYVFGLLGVILLLDLIASKSFVFQKQAVALFIGLAAPWVTNVLYLTNFLPKTGIDPTPIAFSISGVLYLYAIKQYGLLRENPAPNKRAREMVFNRMQEGAVVLDNEDNIVDTNDRAVEIFDTDKSSMLDLTAAAVIPEFEEIPPEGELQKYLTIANNGEQHHYEVEATKIRSAQNIEIGRVITFNAITTFLLQQQRLEVLHRVLRHNIRTKTNLIMGYAEEIDDEYADTVKEYSRRIDELGDKGREAIELFDTARSDTEPRQLDTIIRGAISHIEEKYPQISVTFHRTDTGIYTDGVFEPVIRNVIENAADHNTTENQKLWIEARTEGDNLHICIADNGPGIDEYELAVLSEGSETDLKHGSGLGLWIIKWGTDLGGGTVSFRENKPTGTIVDLNLPTRDGR